MELTTVARHVAAFYRLTGSTSDDDGLTENGESTDDVAYLCLTRGARRAQMYLLESGLKAWRTRSEALSWSGADATDGGRYSALPSDFLRADGNRKGRSALVEADGSEWGVEVDATEDQIRGDAYYFTDEHVWITHSASPPTTLYLRYFKKHSTMAADLADADLILPVDTRALSVAYAAEVAREESWFLLGPDAEVKIARAVKMAEMEAKAYCRRSKAPREFKKPTRYGSHW